MRRLGGRVVNSSADIPMEDQATIEHPAEAKERQFRRRSALWLLGGLVLLLLSILVALQVFGLWEVYTPETATDTLVLYALSSLNFVAFFIFAFIFVRNLLKLRRERRERQLGSKIKTRLIVYFITVSLLPITAMAVFSYIFFNRSLEKWFGRIPKMWSKRLRRRGTKRPAPKQKASQHGAHQCARVVSSFLARGTAPQLDTLLRGGSFAAIKIVSPDGSEETRFGDGADSIRTKRIERRD